MAERTYISQWAWKQMGPTQRGYSVKRWLDSAPSEDRDQTFMFLAVALHEVQIERQEMQDRAHAAEESVRRLKAANKKLRDNQVFVLNPTNQEGTT